MLEIMVFLYKTMCRVNTHEYYKSLRLDTWQSCGQRCS